MGFWTTLDNRVKRFGVVYMLLIQAAAMFFGLFIASIVPQLTAVHWFWFLLLSFLTNAAPSYQFWFGKRPTATGDGPAE